jgi:hypothetical protein
MDDVVEQAHGAALRIDPADFVGGYDNPRQVDRGDVEEDRARHGVLRTGSGGYSAPFGDTCESTQPGRLLRTEHLEDGLRVAQAACPSPSR